MHLQKFICTFRSSLRIVPLNGHLEAAMFFTQPRYNTILPYLEEEIKENIRAVARRGSMVLVSTPLRAISRITILDSIIDDLREMKMLSISIAIAAFHWQEAEEPTSYPASIVEECADFDKHMDKTALLYTIENGDLLTLRLPVEADCPVEIIRDR
ncbi:hypothetical protein BOTCAL_0223g00230 [Botryotinia calthae]|uniref:Uncharacterized protein n=1 Tax=Botryotinia calthae TaxID=38488 RepID=A0A4Y8CY31_9HELO|nr:hypothetical protein BOTCAL_0223g00230 [Botryotinia calthae]